MYPDVRLRRLRQSGWLRDLVAENYVSCNDLVLPVFVVTGMDRRIAIESLPGIYRLSIDKLIDQARYAVSLGIKMLALFPCVPEALKSDDAAEAYNPDNLICQAIKAIKEADIDIGICCDVALDPYTLHGHDGIVVDQQVDNDQTLEVLCKQALILAQAGADVVAPSDMMDGRVQAVRSFLDQHGFHNINILAYAAKYASQFYGPFRQAVGSSQLKYLSKASYQMDYRNANEAMREIELDIAEGADMIMIKPGMPYLDVIRQAKDNFNIPIFAYQVSGEYTMLKMAAESGIFQWQQVLLESIYAFKRAGANGILTYAALEIAEFISKNN